MTDIRQMGQRAKSASVELRKLGTSARNSLLIEAAEAIIKNTEFILGENLKDIKAADVSGVKAAFIDRLTLNENRIKSMADGLRVVASLPDPLSEILGMKVLENGLTVGQKRVPFGVIGIIYEARPNVSADAFGLCFKSGNAVILKGGKEAVNSNAAIVDVFRKVLNKNSLNADFVQLITDTSREATVEFMKLRGLVDVLIPRGGASLINSVIENSLIPVIETGVGNCHIFVDETADFEMAERIILNAKTQRVGVCNACEKLLLHEKIADGFLPKIFAALKAKNVEIRGDKASCSICPKISAADDADWSTEYLDYIIAVAVVKDIDSAISHIEKYSSGHSEAIITENYQNAMKFHNEIDSAAVYVNASTRFTDGSEFGMGAEIGISTQKLHARGPMGLKELTTTKYIIFGNGQIRG